jgi:hypothetical protein
MRGERRRSITRSRQQQQAGSMNDSPSHNTEVFLPPLEGSHATPRPPVMDLSFPVHGTGTECVQACTPHSAARAPLLLEPPVARLFRRSPGRFFALLGHVPILSSLLFPPAPRERCSQPGPQWCNSTSPSPRRDKLCSLCHRMCVETPLSLLFFWPIPPFLFSSCHLPGGCNELAPNPCAVLLLCC